MESSQYFPGIQESSKNLRLVSLIIVVNDLPGEVFVVVDPGGRDFHWQLEWISDTCRLVGLQS